MIPPLSICTEVDRRVDAYDVATLPELPPHGRATAAFAEICQQWERFAALVESLSVALSQPFATGAPQTLQRANALFDDDASQLSHRLKHVGDALAHRQGSAAPCR